MQNKSYEPKFYDRTVKQRFMKVKHESQPLKRIDLMDLTKQQRFSEVKSERNVDLLILEAIVDHNLVAAKLKQRREKKRTLLVSLALGVRGSLNLHSAEDRLVELNGVLRPGYFDRQLSDQIQGRLTLGLSCGLLSSSVLNFLVRH